MSEENVEIVRRALEIWSSGDIEGLIETMDPEVRFNLSERIFNPGVYEPRWLSPLRPGGR
jgi:ketosteroid isomerase-like protein